MFILLISVNFVFAVPPFQTSQQADDLIILYPKTDVFKVDKTANLYYHIMNSTSGRIINGTKVNCIAHVYNTTNNHIIQKVLPTYSNNIDKELIINSSFLNNEGVYGINIFCNTTSQAGYLSHNIYITRDGKGILDNNLGTYFIGSLIGIIGIIAMLLIIYIKSDDVHRILKTFIIFFVVYLTAIIPRIIYVFYSNAFTIDLISYYTFFLRIFTIYIVGYYIWTIADYFGKTAGLKRFVYQNFRNKGGK